MGEGDGSRCNAGASSAFANLARLAAAVLLGGTLLFADGPDAAVAAPKDYTTKDVIEFFKAVQSARKPSGTGGEAPASATGAASGGVCLGTPDECLRPDEAASDTAGRDGPAAPADASSRAVASVAPDTVEEGDAFDLLVAFDYDSAELSAAAKARLRRFAAGINSPDLREAEFLIQGHTDARGTFAYNQNLSFRRAAAVVQFLATEGVDAGRLTAQGFGEQAPRVADPYDPVNRRVQSRLLP